MAIPAIPTNFVVQQANLQVYLSWNIESGATSYSVQRSTDGVTYASLATPAVNSYLDTAVTAGTLYYYQIAATNASGTSPYTSPASIVPTPTGEYSLGQLRELAQQKADLVNSQFITTKEWNSYINLALFELYDLLVTVYEDYFIATPAQFLFPGNQYIFPLPNGVTSYTNGITGATGYIAPPFYKLVGVDLGLSTAGNAWVTVQKFNFMDRNRFIYPNTASTIYGVFNLQYRLIDNNIMFIPQPQGGQFVRIWYVPRLTELLQDTDTTSQSVSGWAQYAIVRAAKYALDKEESDTTKLDAELLYLKSRIEASAVNRDAGQPDKVVDVRLNSYWGDGRFGTSGSSGGF